MTYDLQDWTPEQFHQLHRRECISEEGRRLAALIDAHVTVMRQASDLGRPALAALLPILNEELRTELLENDKLLTAFGHMARLKLEMHGYAETGKQETRWPFDDRESEFAVFQRSG